MTGGGCPHAGEPTGFVEQEIQQVGHWGVAAAVAGSSGGFLRGRIAFEDALLDFFHDFGEHGGVFCFHNVSDASGRDEHASHEFFGGFPEFCLFFGWCEIEVGDQFSKSLLIHLFAVVVVPLDNFLLVGSVVAIAHEGGSGISEADCRSGKSVWTNCPQQSVTNGI